ncbi:multidrug resistance-associated protein 4 isoform X1 [Lingula anatina]|uniref:Multidrug resistance-associated protein 4 isoform X1 n=1 Tax=Lingula anatina TaxID=7574 RepID=A0A2R2MIT5_LINAN|nr:multidrug resistance-associated protein 4 isoform X1 [Lingula anatina]|eukprot:XP_023930136.1 multidrug resistance-associated protein 4 isoform X1 [Lingula anatina]
MFRVSRCHYSAGFFYNLLGLSGVRLLLLAFVIAVVVTSDITLGPSVVFPLILYVHFLSDMVSDQVGNALIYGGMGYTTVKRVQEFLLLEELGSDTCVEQSFPEGKNRKCGVIVDKVTASWEKEVEAPTLKEVSFQLTENKLLSVIGPVGSGKSSLLMAILKELPLSKGSIKITGKIAYASQQAWIFSASVKQNIIFGQEFNKAKYDRVIKACALTKDIQALPNGDMTLVGERGVSLSGGQRARVSLARAVYFDADVYLLDDPLSAVDTAVGRHLFNQCINGCLKDKPRILVTHQLQYVEASDQILILKEGEMAGLGTFSELVSKGIDFASLLSPEEEERDEGSTCTDPDIQFTVDTPKLSHKPHLSVSHPQLPIIEKLRAQNDLAVLMKDQKKQGSGGVGGGGGSVGSSAGSSRKTSPRSSGDRLHVVPTDVQLSKSHPNIAAWKPLKKNALQTASTYSLSSKVSLANDYNPYLSVGKSMLSLHSFMDMDQPDYVPAQEEEQRAEGSVGWKIYRDYFKAGGGCCVFLLLVTLNILAQVAYVMSDWWLSYWSNQEEHKASLSARHQYLLEQGYNVTNITVPNVDTNLNIYIFTGLTVSVFMFGLLRALMFFKVCVDASRNLHNKMFHSIIRVPVYFFDTNPVGRILNRFAKDTGQMDDLLPVTFFDFTQCFLMILGIIVVAGVVNPWVFIPTLPLCLFFVYLRRYYLATSRDIKRLEGTCRSPVFSHLSATLNGLSTIRAYHVEELFGKEFNSHQDLHTEAWFLFLVTTRWFAIRLDWICAFFVTTVTMVSILARDNLGLNAGLVGLAVTYSMALMGMFQWGVRQSAEVENQMTSVERVLEYSRLTPEAPLESNKKPPPNWPSHGIITGEQASFRYSVYTPAVLNNLHFCIKSNEKVGIVGRTGAGKSSLINMLFRMAEPQGVLRIDGVDIGEIGLHDLRGKISIIPQDPVLFTGTVRSNLDPFNEHSDDQLWMALEEVEMKIPVDDLPRGLESEVTEGGTNFSVGQRQLLCLARAILKKAKILVIDEATANVDIRTDSFIQETIREKFDQCTVLTIAHRLNTVMDSDRIMVLDQGKIREFDEPYTLLQNEDSFFFKMVEQTGKQDAATLKDMARQAFTHRQLSRIDSYVGEESKGDNSVEGSDGPSSQPEITSGDKMAELPNGKMDDPPGGSQVDSKERKKEGSPASEKEGLPGGKMEDLPADSSSNSAGGKIEEKPSGERKGSLSSEEGEETRLIVPNHTNKDTVDCNAQSV